MFCFWTYLSLFFVLQHSVSADAGVTLKCSRTVEVTSGDTVTLNCDIIWTKNCEKNVGKFIWKEANNNNNLCDLEGNTCKSDGQTYGSLTISNIQKNKTITVGFFSVCGIDGSLIRVLVYDEHRDEHTDEHSGHHTDKDTDGHKTDEEKKNSTAVILIFVTILFVVFAVIIVMVILFFQFKIKQIKKLHKLDELHHRSMDRILDF